SCFLRTNHRVHRDVIAIAALDLNESVNLGKVHRSRSIIEGTGTTKNVISPERHSVQTSLATA
uniref:hypothetical protein n=1 Tax=Vibrio vulnificus TaxID=672 RepID=UPI001EE9F09D